MGNDFLAGVFAAILTIAIKENIIQFTTNDIDNPLREL